MKTAESIHELAEREYKYGFVTDIETDMVPPGLDEDIIRLISAKKNEPEFMLEWRLKAFRHWKTLKEPTWANVHYPPIDYQRISTMPRRNEVNRRVWTRSLEIAGHLRNSEFL